MVTYLLWEKDSESNAKRKALKRQQGDLPRRLEDLLSPDNEDLLRRTEYLLSRQRGLPHDKEDLPRKLEDLPARQRGLSHDKGDLLRRPEDLPSRGRGLSQDKGDLPRPQDDLSTPQKVDLKGRSIRPLEDPLRTKSEGFASFHQKCFSTS